MNTENRYGIPRSNDSRLTQPEDASGDYSNLQSEVARGTIPPSEIETEELDIVEDEDSLPFDLRAEATSESEEESPYLLEDENEQSSGILNDARIFRLMTNILADRKIASSGTNGKNEEV